MTKSNRHRARSKSRRRFHLESLETRAVLSADCGVTCELVDGVLHVAGTDASDAIEIRYDSESKTVNVYGSQELVGQYGAHAIQRLQIQGFAGDDKFQVGESLPVPAYVDGGEGEDSLSTAAAKVEHSHSHAAQVDAAITALSVEHEEVGDSAVGHDVLDSVLPLILGGGSFVGLSPSAAAYSAGQHGHEHGSAARVTAVSSGTSSMTFYAKPSAKAESNTLAGNASVATVHEHAPAISTTASFGVGLMVAESQTAKLDGKFGKGRDGTSHHGDLAIKQQGSTAYTAKWCTTTPWAKQLIASFDGKAKCKCDAPKAEPAGSPSLAATTQSAVAIFGLSGLSQDSSVVASRAAQWSSLQEVLLQAWDADELCSEGSMHESHKRLECGYDKYARLTVPERPTPQDAAVASQLAGTEEADATWIVGAACLVAGTLVTATLLERKRTEIAAKEFERPPVWLNFEPLGV